MSSSEFQVPSEVDGVRYPVSIFVLVPLTDGELAARVALPATMDSAYCLGVHPMRSLKTLCRYLGVRLTFWAISLRVTFPELLLDEVSRADSITAHALLRTSSSGSNFASSGLHLLHARNPAVSACSFVSKKTIFALRARRALHTGRQKMRVDVTP